MCHLMFVPQDWGRVSSNVCTSGLGTKHVAPPGYHMCSTRISHEDITCAPPGYHMCSTRISHVAPPGYHMCSTRISHVAPPGYHMWLHQDITCAPPGYHMCSTRISHVLHQDITCAPPGPVTTTNSLCLGENLLAHDLFINVKLTVATVLIFKKKMYFVKIIIKNLKGTCK